MTYGEVINKLSLEMALALGDLDTRQTCATYLQMALTIGTEHFTREMEEVIALNKWGEEQGRFKGVRDASLKLGIPRGNIYNVLEGKRPTAGGFIFIRSKDKELIPAKKTA